MKTGIFSGSFNPIHIGHLALANYLCEFAGLDEVWFVVSPLNPLKDEADLLDNDLRLEMVSLAIGNYPKFKASDFEFTLPPYSLSEIKILSPASAIFAIA
jgi:nicotinate-nucleotide adenylyltransferase